VRLGGGMEAEAAFRVVDRPREPGAGNTPRTPPTGGAHPARARGRRG
jgi:hypothetical protein